jgi:hypothetical protein
LIKLLKTLQSIISNQSSIINYQLIRVGDNMNTFWLKIAGVVVVAVLIIVVIGKFRSSKPTSTSVQQPRSEQPEKPKGFYGMAERDKQFLEEPKRADEQKSEQSQEQVPEPQTPQQPAQAPIQPAGRTPGVVLPSDIKGPTKLYFKPLEEIDDIQAQELLPWATTGRSIGRLPMLQYGLMVKACRQIEQRWPDSWYAFRAKQMLEEISERYAANYKITEQELNISRFLKPRRDTEPRIVEPIRR